MKRKTMLIVTILSCVILSGCINRQLEEVDYEEDFVINDFDMYVETLFGITDAIYGYEKIGDLYPLLENYMANLNLSYDNNELKELAYHILEKAPNYIGTQESNIRSVITIEYILVNYSDMDLTPQEKKLEEALKGAQGFYLHTYTGSKKSSDQVLGELEKSSQIHAELKEEKFYADR